MMKANKKVLISIIIITILTTLFIRSTIFTTCIAFVKATIWYFTENHTVACGNASMTIKFPWFSALNEDREISLTKVPNIWTGFYGVVQIVNHDFDTSSLINRMHLKSINNLSVVAEGVKTLQLSGKSSYSIRYYYTKNKLQGRYYEVIGIPESKICLYAIDVPIKDTANINKLIQSIQLK